MERIGAGLPKLLSIDDLNEDLIDLARLTTAEQHDLCRLMGQVQRVGLAGLSDDDLERFLYLREILDGEESSGDENSACD
jgi:hypothetical protein